jgi:hypothetical protein
MRMRRLRWLDLLAVVLVVWIGLALWRSLPPNDGPRGRIEALRAAFDRAAAQCYDQYRGAELQACLAGVMEAHLHALGAGGEEPEESEVAPAGLGQRL